MEVLHFCWIKYAYRVHSTYPYKNSTYVSTMCAIGIEFYIITVHFGSSTKYGYRKSVFTYINSTIERAVWRTSSR
jgi:hypothetical protein